jgi:hypothetical protein
MVSFVSEPRMSISRDACLWFASPVEFPRNAESLHFYFRVHSRVEFRDLARKSRVEFRSKGRIVSFSFAHARRRTRVIIWYKCDLLVQMVHFWQFAFGEIFSNFFPVPYRSTKRRQETHTPQETLTPHTEPCSRMKRISGRYACADGALKQSSRVLHARQCEQAFRRKGWLKATKLRFRRHFRRLHRQGRPRAGFHSW